MTEKHSCPLCHAPAMLETNDSGKIRRYLCDSCGEFIITDTAERRLARSIPEFTAGVMVLVKSAPGGMILSLRMAPVSEQQHGAWDRVFDHEYIPR